MIAFVWLPTYLILSSPPYDDAAANEAIVDFRHEISSLLKDQSATRIAAKNWGYPLAMPRAIEL